MGNVRSDELLTRWNAADLTHPEIADQVRTELFGHKDVFLQGLKIAILNQTEPDIEHLLALAMLLKNDPDVTDLFNTLLLDHRHTRHQSITWTLQQLGDPRSVPYIRQALEEGFGSLAYTCSDDGVIAKWFSWALSAIGTSEALAVLREFCASPNAEIAAEMRYRLGKFEQKQQ